MRSPFSSKGIGAATTMAIILLLFSWAEIPTNTDWPDDAIQIEDAVYSYSEDCDCYIASSSWELDEDSIDGDAVVSLFSNGAVFMLSGTIELCDEDGDCDQRDVGITSEFGVIDVFPAEEGVTGTVRMTMKDTEHCQLFTYMGIGSGQAALKPDMDFREPGMAPTWDRGTIATRQAAGTGTAC
ncbi:hypothetical protein [Salininema proteolyticum]|uniref:Uncharacterized protein n=1 Tax=Salininema proteolyticum TaxID=1607685 RepID=A0ABV8U310_9ACTN